MNAFTSSNEAIIGALFGVRMNKPRIPGQRSSKGSPVF